MRTKKPLPVHPAPYSDTIVPVIHRLVHEYAPTTGILLDPMAGLGQRLPEIAGDDFRPVGVEIERAYFDLNLVHPCVRNGDSTAMTWCASDSVAAAATSTPYPNGVSDNFWSSPEDTSRRHNYVWRIRQFIPGYELHPNNSGGMNPRRSPKALRQFMELHKQVYAEVFRVLKPGAPFVWNGKDTLRVAFTQMTIFDLVDIGFNIVHSEVVGTPGLNHGENHELKVQGETVLVAVKPAQQST